MPRGAAPAKTKVDASPPVARKPRGDAEATVRELENRLAAALAQQAATSEILRVISASPTDVQPVLDAVAERAARLCNAPYARVLLREGDMLQSRAHFALDGSDSIPALPVTYKRTSISGRATLDRAIVHHGDVVPLLETEFPDARGNARLIGCRAVLAVPLTREDVAYGAIFLWRREPGLFAPDQVALVETFARQVAIAVDNVRLFKETKEALEQQTATSEILRAISGSPTDAGPVFETIAANALRLCDATFSICYRFDGELIHIAALHHLKPEGIAAFRAAYPSRPSRHGATQRAILTGSIVHIADVLEDPEYTYHDAARSADYRSVLAVPMLRDGRPIGAVTVFREAPRLLPDKQVALLKTFADQAVIAVENVRLFNELEARNRELTDALEQQNATSEVLKVISRSAFDLQPVLDTVIESAVRLCGAEHGHVHRYDGELLRLAAGHSTVPAMLDYLREHPAPLGPGSISGIAGLERRPIHWHDVLAQSGYKRGEAQKLGGYRTMLAVPMLRDDTLLGVMVIWKTRVEPFTDKQIELVTTFADQAVIAIENVRLFNELKSRNSELTVALDQQTATSEILRVISRSQTDIQPVFDIIARSAGKLCDAEVAVVSRFDGTLIELAAIHGLVPEGVKMVRTLFPMQLGAQTFTARAIRSAAVVHIADVLADPDYEIKDFARAAHYRSGLAVPVVRNGQVIGSIFVGRARPGLFTDAQVHLLRTFADQAVIAIENVRLFTELDVRNRDLTEALEQQTATSEILRVISQSQTDVQPIFETIAAAALRLCRASVANVVTLDGEMLHMQATANVSPEGADALRRSWPRPVGEDTAAGRAVQTGRVVAIPDVLDDGTYAIGASANTSGFRSVVCVPLVRDGSPVGAISVGRREPGPFSDNHIALLKTFADQAVIAIENVRLFTELEARNRDITEALEQQTATSEILRVISSSPTDVQPVFDIIGESAEKLCDAELSLVSRIDGDLIQLVAAHGVTPGGTDIVRAHFPMRLSAETVTARSIRSRAVVHVEDVLAEPSYEAKDAASAGGFRGCLGVPMLREGQVIGSIFVGRRNPGRYSDSQVDLLKTFADQAVIAIENVRLFTELQASTKELTQLVGELKALGEVGQAVSSTLDLETVLMTIVSQATQLPGVDSCAIYEYDEIREEFYLHTADRLPDELVEALRSGRIRKGEGALGQLAVTFEPVEVRDIADKTIYRSRVREMLLRLGYRSLLAVPLLREDHLLGGLVVNRKRAGKFAPQLIDLMKTFATQSALAIQNARLFREIEDKSRQLEVASQHKSEFLANMSHELRTPLNAIIGFSEVLYERMFGEINDKQAEYLADILESGRHLLSLINDILDLSKIEAGRMELDVSEFSLAGAIDNTLTLVRERAHRRGIALERAIDDRIGKVRADERKVKQVLLNLLSNALKFTPEGGRIGVRADAHDDGTTEVSVTDTGVGIAPGDQASVFEEFRQVGLSAKKVEGTGLGLAISRKFIELHGGKIWVTSTVGVGSTFAFTLPPTGSDSQPAD